MKRFLTSFWSIFVAGALGLAVHDQWLRRAEHQGEVLSALGTYVAAMGVWLAAIPYLEKGVAGAVEANMPPRQSAILDGEDDHTPARDSLRKQLRTEVIIERVAAFSIILGGTALNGYGMPIARALGMRI